MKLLANLLGGRHRNGQVGVAARVRSLGDLDGHFPWVDLGLACGSPARAEIRNPLAVAVRSVRVLEYAQATGSEHGDDGMVLLGLSGALHALGRHGEWDAVGTLLNALEILVSPVDRARWLDGLDPYVEAVSA